MTLNVPWNQTRPRLSFSLSSTYYLNWLRNVVSAWICWKSTMKGDYERGLKLLNTKISPILLWTELQNYFLELHFNNQMLRLDILLRLNGLRKLQIATGKAIHCDRIISSNYMYYECWNIDNILIIRSWEYYQ